MTSVSRHAADPAGLLGGCPDELARLAPRELLLAWLGSLDVETDPALAASYLLGRGAALTAPLAELLRAVAAWPRPRLQAIPAGRRPRGRALRRTAPSWPA